MAIIFTNWLKNTLGKKENSTEMCQESKKCMEILELLLDGEADSEQEVFFRDHIERCMPCYQHYNLEKTIKELLKTKIEKKPVPNDLVDSIKLKIKETV
jgi:anti-sigma factor (TIGR02949 family)